MPGVADILSLGVAPARAKVLCVLVHGRNQSPEEMEAAVIRRLSASDVAYVLPRAEGKSWYTARAIDPLTAATRGELSASLSGLATAISDLRAMGPGAPLVLAGFSQGACLSLEHAFTGTHTPAAVAAFTGCRVGVPGDDRQSLLQRGLPVYLSAGSADPWIPLQAFADTVTELGHAAATLRCDVFPARPHEVSATEIALLDNLLTDLSAGRSPRMEAPR